MKKEYRNVTLKKGIFLDSIPMLFITYKKAMPMLKHLYPLASLMNQFFFQDMDTNLKKIHSTVGAKEFLSGALLALIFYTFFGFLFLTLVSLRNPDFFELDFIASNFFLGFFLGLSIFVYNILVPTWYISKMKKEVEKDLFFATRHLMIHTSAGVPLFDALVSISQQYEDNNFNYGEVSNEFAEIVKEVKGGKELTLALEQSAMRNESFYFRRLMWQLANANKSGSNIGNILKHMVEFMSKEQENMLKNYGAQLNPLAMFYMMVCIIAPTMGIILLSIASSIININLSEPVLVVFLIIIAVVQFLFFGMIKSRRPPVSI